MRPDLAIEKLEALKNVGHDVADAPNHWAKIGSWRANINEVVGRALGKDHALLERLEHAWRSGPMYGDYTEVDLLHMRLEMVEQTRQLIASAIYALGLAAEVDEPVDESSFDPELWAHVRGLVDAGDWGKVATQAAVFTEDKVRKWSNQDGAVVGKNMYAHALSNAGELRLGAQSNEWEGWRNLGMGFAQATSNVDRHHVQIRPDLKRYAVGVLGLASLLLTQMRHAHAELIEQRDSSAS
ncbi:hypothetical protein AYK61_01365 [Rhodococcus sp. SBT000017]|uniref:TIGR02391 family protein n=2 Tax=unclassified Rhodococcus (in: high G+C Gram-positive bacteria) TaxID=192944 RepID=UPI000EF8865A|nr:TIGR02391 family protein [Rhodococcus sp. SBT000017]RMB75446.1 hypothetical protein AYK61_01365 [Rhodococcus sp. SBT000017]